VPAFVLPCSPDEGGTQESDATSSGSTAASRSVLDTALALISARPKNYFVGGPELRLALGADRQQGNAMIQSCVPQFLVRTESANETYFLTLEGLLEASNGGPKRVLESALKVVREQYGALVSGGGRLSWNEIVKRGAHTDDARFADLVFYACQMAQAGYAQSGDTFFTLRWSTTILESVVELQPGVGPFRAWFKRVHPPENALAPLNVQDTLPSQPRICMFHIRLEVKGEKKPEFAWDLDES
jgi:hypothetical protein